MMMMPKCTGSTPSVLTTGSNMGVRIKISGAMSIKVPRTSSMMLMKNKIT